MPSTFCMLLWWCVYRTQDGFPGGTGGKEPTYQCRRRKRSLDRENLWRRAWQTTPVFLPGESHGERSLMGYNPWGHKEYMTEQLSTYRNQEGHVNYPSVWNSAALSTSLRNTHSVSNSFSSPQVEILPRWTTTLLFSQPWETTFWLFCKFDCFKFLPLSGVIEYLSSGDRLISHSRRLIHTVAGVRMPSLFKAASDSAVCTEHVLFMDLSVGEHCIASYVWLLWIMLLWPWVYMCLFDTLLSILWVMYPEVALLNHTLFKQ